MLLVLPRECDPDPDPDAPAVLGLNFLPRASDGEALRGGRRERGKGVMGVVMLPFESDAPRAGVTKVGELALLRLAVAFTVLVGEIE
jgi:hypothetical protein